MHVAHAEIPATLPVHSGHDFDYSRRHETYTAEMCDLTPAPLCGQMVDGVAQLGFIIESQWTGRMMAFALERVEDAAGNVINDPDRMGEAAVTYFTELAGKHIAIVYNDSDEG